MPITMDNQQLQHSKTLYDFKFNLKYWKTITHYKRDAIKKIQKCSPSKPMLLYMHVQLQNNTLTASN